MKVITIFIAAGLVFAAAGQSTSDEKANGKTVNGKTANEKTANGKSANGKSANGKSEDKKQQPRKVTRTPEPPTIPKDATPLADGSYRYVDKDGRKWIYMRTPFGVSKAEEHPPVRPPKVEDDPAKSEDLGDSVRFTRPTPFGPKIWTTQKSELSDWERIIFERDNKAKTQPESAQHDQKEESKQPTAK